MAQSELPVTFTDEIPKIEREGFSRNSKYTPLLDACVERVGKAAKVTVESQGAASSRASSIREAAGKHPAEAEGKGNFTVATRSGESDNEFHVYVQFNAADTEDYDEEVERRQAREVRAEERKANPTPRKRPVKKTAAKA